MPSRSPVSRRTFLILVVSLLFIVCVETLVYITLRPAPLVTSNRQAALSIEQAQAYILATPDLEIIDVRSKKEFAGSHLPNAMNMPLYAFSEKVKEIPKGRPVLLHCMHGVRAQQAYKLLRKLRPDLTEVRYVAGQLVHVPLRKVVDCNE